MTTHSYTAVVDQTSDAGFRAWGSLVSAAWAAIGLVQTSDTGQINWTTVTRASSNTAAGYEIWRLANSSLYFKFEYGSSSANFRPEMWVTVGTGSNGSGTLTGQTSTRNTFTIGLEANNVAVAKTSYFCATTDGVFVCWNQNGHSVGAVNAGGSLAIHRSVDADGVTTTDGFMVVRQDAQNGHLAQSVRTASPAFTGTESAFNCIAAGSPTSSLDVNGDNRVWLYWSDYKEGMEPFIGCCAYVAAEWGETTTKSLTLFGLTAHTYMAVGTVGTGGSANNRSGTYNLAIIYE